MGITIFISLYTTRLILASLGASDFGIYNIVGGAIAMLGFLNSTLANATQRFMSYAEGEGHLENKKKIFNVSLVLHLIIALATSLLLIGVMFPLFGGMLNIPPDRILSAKIVYTCLILSTILTIINVPYDAVMNAHENMLYYSIIGIIESILKLAVALACVYTVYDKLIVYGLLMALIPLFTLSVMKLYCHKHYEECIIAPIKYWDTELIRKISSFSGWNFLTAISSLFTAQGIGLVLNHFFGTLLNAAQGVANQVNGQMSSFSANMMKALNPVIVKNAGAQNINAMNRMTIAGCKFSALLTILFAIPFMLEMNFILSIWLKEVPEWTATFCVMQLIQTIICQMANSAATAIYAHGRIKYYAIYKSIMNIMPVVITYFSFTLGGGPIWLYIPMIVVWAIGGNIIIVKYANKHCGLSINGYLKDVVLPIIIVSSIMLVIGAIPTFIFDCSFIRLITTCLITTIAMVASSWFFVCSSTDKMLIMKLVLNK